MFLCGIARGVSGIRGTSKLDPTDKKPLAYWRRSALLGLNLISIIFSIHSCCDSADNCFCEHCQ